MERLAVLKCGVCFERFLETAASTRGDSSHHAVASGCGHVYHHGCLRTWLNINRSQRTCPSCRTQICRTDVVRIYPEFTVVESDELENVKRRLKREEDTKIVLFYIIVFLLILCISLLFDRAVDKGFLSLSW